MRKKLLLLLCCVALGLAVSGCVITPTVQTVPGPEESEALVQTMAWWSLMYEAPNPERLPVKVRFQWLKGLE